MKHRKILGIMLAVMMIMTMGVFTSINVAASGAITTGAISGVTQPVAGATAVTTAPTLTNTTSSTITWSPALDNGKFKGDTAYTATFTLTANSGSSFDGLNADALTVADATTVTHPAVVEGGTVTVKALFPKTNKTLSGAITLKAPEVDKVLPTTVTLTNAQTISDLKWFEVVDTTATEVTSTANYTFKANAVYKATFTVKPSTGYTLGGLAENKLTVAGATVTHVAGVAATHDSAGLEVTAVFKKTEAGTVTATKVTIDNVRVTGIISTPADTTAPLTKGVDVVIKLEPANSAGFNVKVGDTNEVKKDNDVTSWFTNLPTGLTGVTNTAKVKSVATDGKSVTVTLTGTPTGNANGNAIAVKVPKDAIAIGNTIGQVAPTADIVATENKSAVWDIVKVISGKIAHNATTLDAMATADNYIDLINEVVVIGETDYKTLVYSLNGGEKWADVKDALSNDKFQKILNKGGTMYLSDKKYDKKAKALEPGATVIQFAEIAKRPKFEKLIVNYALKAPTSPADSGKWTISEKGATEVTEFNLIYGASKDGKKPDDGYAAFDKANGVPVEVTATGAKQTKSVYLFRMAPSVSESGVYTPASKIKKFSVLSTLKTPTYKFKASAKNEIKIKKNTYYGANGTDFTDGSAMAVKIEADATFQIWVGATEKKPASSVQSLAVKYTAPAAE